MRYYKLLKVLMTIILIQISIKAISYNKKLQEFRPESFNLENLRSLYIERNLNFEIKNSKFLNITNNKEFLVILIQVHDRFENLKILIESLRFTKYISDTIVIFSHDFIDPKINDYIEKVDFAAVIQFQYYI